MRRKSKKPVARRRWPPSNAALDALIEEATIDGYGEPEQATSFCTVLDEHVAVPFDTSLLGIAVTVERIAMTDNDRIVAVCRRGRSRQTISLVDLPIPSPPPTGAEWIEAYRRWARWQ